MSTPNIEIDPSLPTDSSLLEPTYINYQDLIDPTMDTDIIYERLLEELYDVLDCDKATHKDEDKLPNLDIVFDISKKTVWKNFKNFINAVQRKETDITDFIKNEYGRTPSINKHGHLLITGRYTSIMSNTIRKYVQLFVKCPACGSLKTTISKNHHMGIDYLICTKRNCSSPIIKNK